MADGEVTDRADQWHERAPLTSQPSSRRQRIAHAAQTLRIVRDTLEVLNEPYDPELGTVHARLAVLVNDLRDLARPAPMQPAPDQVGSVVP